MILVTLHSQCPTHPVILVTLHSDCRTHPMQLESHIYSLRLIYCDLCMFMRCEQQRDCSRHCLQELSKKTYSRPVIDSSIAVTLHLATGGYGGSSKQHESQEPPVRHSGGTDGLIKTAEPATQREKQKGPVGTACAP
jgi:hypothetical protein